MRIPIVQTIHNYRLKCSNGFFWRKNQNCTKCVQNNIWGVVHRCYRGSLAGSLTTKIFQDNTINNPEWIKSVTLFFVLSKYAKKQFLNLGIPEEKIFIKPNFSNKITEVQYKFKNNNEYIFIGRLEENKNIELLVDFFNENQNLNLKIIGSGPLENKIKNLAKKNIKILGFISNFDEISKHMANSRALIFPSKSHESQPMTLVEAMQIGIPIICMENQALLEFFQSDYPKQLFFKDKKSLLESITFLNNHDDIQKISNSLKNNFTSFDKTHGLNNLVNGYKKAFDLNNKSFN